MKAAATYFDRTMTLLERLRSTQMEALDKAAAICADAIAEGGLVFLFGSGHSRMLAEEMMPRQGCFPGFVALVEHALCDHANVVGPNGLRGPLYLEKYEGYAEEILKGFHFGPRDVFVVISTSGIRPVAVEMALGAKRRGLPVIAIVSLAHSRSVAPAHSSGKKLADIADVVLDNQCPPGDCILEVEGLEWRTGPTSTVTGAMLINMLRCEVAERLTARGITPVVFPSHQVTGNASVERQMEAFYEAYRRSLRHLYE